VITQKKGGEAVQDIDRWVKENVAAADPSARASAYYDPDSSTYVLRLEKGSRVLLFRLSEAQAGTPTREKECEKLLKRKLKDLSA
jgi:hypothetical protein